MEDCSRGNGLRVAALACKHPPQGSRGGVPCTPHPWHGPTGDGSATARLGRGESRASLPSQSPPSQAILIINTHGCHAESRASTSVAGHEPRARGRQPRQERAGRASRAGEAVGADRGAPQRPHRPAEDEGGSPTCWQPVESRWAPAPRRDHALHPLGLGGVVEAEEGGLAQADGAAWGERGQGSAATAVPERGEAGAGAGSRALPGPKTRPREGSGLLPSPEA